MNLWGLTPITEAESVEEFRRIQEARPRRSGRPAGRRPRQPKKPPTLAERAMLPELVEALGPLVSYVRALGALDDGRGFLVRLSAAAPRHRELEAIDIFEGHAQRLRDAALTLATDSHPPKTRPAP